jgi:flavin-dependent dehydrogenase
MSSEHQVAMTPALRAGEQRVKTGCCIAGGGPAGLMLGYLLARAGVEVVVVEKHADFHRDFRGDTVHPSTLQVLDELALLDDFLRIPHSELREFHGMVGRRLMRAADFRHVPGRCKFIAIMPQWDFLNFLADRARRLPAFRLEMNAEATDLVVSGTRVTGIRAKTPHGSLAIDAETRRRRRPAFGAAQMLGPAVRRARCLDRHPLDAHFARSERSGGPARIRCRRMHPRCD